MVYDPVGGGNSASSSSRFSMQSKNNDSSISKGPKFSIKSFAKPSQKFIENFCIGSATNDPKLPIVDNQINVPY